MESVLIFSQETYAGTSVDVQGMGLTRFPAPQHKFTMFSVMGANPSFPMARIQIILENDLAGELLGLWPDETTSLVSPTSQGQGSDSPKTSSLVLPTCAVTRAMSHDSGGSCLDNLVKRKSAASGYFLGLLVNKWVPQGYCFVS